MVKRHEAFEKFNVAYLLARESLKSLHVCVEKHLASGEAPRFPAKGSKPKPQSKKKK